MKRPEMALTPGFVKWYAAAFSTLLGHKCPKQLTRLNQVLHHYGVWMDGLRRAPAAHGVAWWADLSLVEWLDRRALFAPKRRIYIFEIV